MKNKIEDQIENAVEENKKQIKRYFNQEKELINSGHKDFAINFERKQMPVKNSDQKIQQPLLNDKLQEPSTGAVGAGIGLAKKLETPISKQENH